MGSTQAFRTSSPQHRGAIRARINRDHGVAVPALDLGPIFEAGIKQSTEWLRGQSYSAIILHSVIFGLLTARVRNDVAIYKFVWERVHSASSSPTLRRRTLATGSYILGRLRPIEPVYSSSRPSLYLIVPWHFRFGRASACPRLGGRCRRW